MEIHRPRGRPRKQKPSNIMISDPAKTQDTESSDDLKQFELFKCKNFEINLSLENPFLDSSYLLNGETEKIDLTKFRPSLSIRTDEVSKRKSFPLQSKQKLGIISSRRSLRLNNCETDKDELTFDTVTTKIDDVETYTSTKEDKTMKSEKKYETLVAFEDHKTILHENSTNAEVTGYCNNAITEQELDSVENVENNRENSVMTQTDYKIQNDNLVDPAGTECCDTIITKMESDLPDNPKTSKDNLVIMSSGYGAPKSSPENQESFLTTVENIHSTSDRKPEEENQPLEYEPQKKVALRLSTEISPRKKTAEVLRQLQTTLNPKMTDVSNNNQDNIKLSRFGRHQKVKSGFEDFIPVEITRFINVSPSKQKKSSISVKSHLETKITSPTKEAAIMSPLLSPTKSQIQFPGHDEACSPTVETEKCYQPGQIGDMITTDAGLALGSSGDEVATKLGNGDVLWGSVSNSVFWPCLVCPDPDSGQTTISRRSGVNKTKVFVHVRFFSDNGRRCWLKTQKTLEFSGIQDLDTKLLETANWDKKQKRVPTDNQRPFWKSAILQAQESITYNKQERYGIYLQLLEKERLERTEQMKLKRSSVSTTISAENLLKFQSERGRKRSRSSSPDSPAFEVLTAEGIKQEVEEDRIRSSCIDRFFKSIEPQGKIRPPPKKKIRLNEDASLKPKDKKTDVTDEIDNDSLFQQFFEGLKATVLTSNSPDLLAELKLYAKRIWLLKIFDAKQVDSENLSRIGNHLNRKLSLRKPSSSGRSRRSSATTTTESVTKPADEIVAVAKAPKIQPSKKEELSLKEMFLSELEKNYLFKHMTRQPVCQLCKKSGGLVQCSGECGSFFHPNCSIEREDCEILNNKYQVQMEDVKPKSLAKFENLVKLEPIEMDEVQEFQAAASKQFQCNECSGKNPHKCFVCQIDTGFGDSKEQTIKCSVNGCGKFFHISCLKNYPQAIIDEMSTLKSLFCPQHCCHTCVSDDPKQKTNRNNNKPPLIKCVACPSSYHFDSGCVPAGSVFLTASQIVCSKHSVVDRKKFLNVNWCFICSSGGTLLCCELCPTSFHQECLDIEMPIQEHYICEVCEAGRMPLYNEIVWAKYSSHRWWPAIILPPPVVPEMMLKKAHTPFDFCIRFFGSHDFCWIKRERVFLYQDGDSDSLKNNDKPVYNRALTEAKEIFEYLKEQKKNEPTNSNRFENRPPIYQRIKCNRPVPPVKLSVNDDQDINDDICGCVATDEEPCGVSSNCINRTLNQECDPMTCPAGLKCCNQCFKKRLYPQMRVKQTPGRGWGLQTLEEIKAGTFVIEYVGELIDSSELEYRLKKKAEQNDENYYFLTINANLIIDAGPKGNLSRFMNHSCDPNCQTQKWTVGGQTRVGLFALKDIQPNTELTFNYNLEAVGDHKKICQCGAKTCSGFIGALKTEGKKTKSKTKVNKRQVVKVKSPNKATATQSIEFVDTGKEESIQPSKRLHVTGDDFQLI